MDAVKIIAGADSVTFLTGAGISTSSGIPGFRCPGGRWTKEPRTELISDLDCYLSDDDLHARAWQFPGASGFWSAKPTRAHQAIAAVDRTRAAGTSLTVQPVARLVGSALGHRDRVVIAHAEQTPWDDRAHVVHSEWDIEPPRLLGVDT